MMGANFLLITAFANLVGLLFAAVAASAYAATTCEMPPVLETPIVYQDKCPGDADFPSTLTAGGRDLYVKLPKDRLCTKKLLIQYARNVHIIGGGFSYHDTAANVVHIRYSSGTALIEGLDINANNKDANAISSAAHTGRMIIQNTRVRGVRGSSGGITRDFMEAQNSGPLAGLKLQNVTVLTAGGGLYSYYNPVNGHGVRKLRLDHVNAAYDPSLPKWPFGSTPPELLYIGSPSVTTCQSPPDGVTLNNVHVDGSYWGLPYKKAVYAEPHPQLSGCATFNSSQFIGEVRLGPAPEGDYTPPDRVGLNYDRAYFCKQETSGTSLPVLGGCTMFTPDDEWNRDVSALPVHQTWTNYFNSHWGNDHIVAVFGDHFGAVSGVPYNVVPQNQPLLPINYDLYGSKSDPGPFPFPGKDTVAIQQGDPYCAGGHDCHILTVQQGTCMLYEGWACRFNDSTGGYTCGAGAKFDLKRTAYGQRPEGWPSSEAAGMPMLAGLIRYEEVAAGEIKHALRVSTACASWDWIKPASHGAIPPGCPDDGPPMGTRIRLKADFDISKYGRDEQVILRALKKYGALLGDNNYPNTYYVFQAAWHQGWSAGQLYGLRSVPNSAFEVVQTYQ